MRSVLSKTPQFCGVLYVHPLGRRDAAGRSRHLVGGRQRRRESASLNLACLSRACLLFNCTGGAEGGEPVGRSSGGLSRQANCLSAALTDRGMSENPLFAETIRACQPVDGGRQKGKKPVATGCPRDKPVRQLSRKRQNCAILASNNLQATYTRPAKKRACRSWGQAVLARPFPRRPGSGVLRGTSGFRNQGVAPGRSLRQRLPQKVGRGVMSYSLHWVAPGTSSPFMSVAASWPMSREGEPGSSRCSTRSRRRSWPRATCRS